MTIGETALRPAYRNRIKGTIVARLPTGRLEVQPEVLRQIHIEEIIIIPRAVREAAIVALKWRYS